jgi:uncharacterized protein
MNKKYYYVIAIITFIIVVLLYSRFIGTSGLVVKERVVGANISNNFHGIKIMHISDIHYGRSINDAKRLKEISDKINLSKPDIVVLTGDLIDRDTILTTEKKNELIEFLNSINANLGKYAIIGNHDVNFKAWDNIILDGGFINVNDTYDLIYKETLIPILIAGVSTNIGIEKELEVKMENVVNYFGNEDSVAPDYSILLIHEPDYLDDIDLTNFDIVLAGHSHQGQVRLPFLGPILLPEGAKNYFEEYYIIRGKPVYISGGIGTSILNFRLFNRPSVNLYRIVKK